jgi:hypothetical protein
MKNWKIGIRIMAGYSAMILITIALGLLAYGKLGGIETSSAVIASNGFPGVYLIGQLQEPMPVHASVEGGMRLRCCCPQLADRLGIAMCRRVVAECRQPLRGIA